MNFGKWFLVYTRQHTWEDGYADTNFEDVRIPLEAPTEVSAIIEARAKWAAVKKEDKQIREKHTNPFRGQPLPPAFGGASPNPHITYEIPLW